MDGKKPENEKKEEEDLFVGLKRMRDTWSDGIPTEIVHNTGTSKARRAWWTAIFLQIDLIILEKVLPEDLNSDAEKFVKEYEEKIRNNPTTDDDIKAANAMIDKILDSQK